MSGIFKSYDVRGLYGTEIGEDIAYKIGRAFVEFLKVREVVVGIDMRESSKSLFKALSKGITDQGANVINIGLASTPMFYFRASKSQSGIIITASHNPSKYNGFKFVRENGIPISGATGIMEIKDIVEKNEFYEAEEKGKIINENIMDEYVDFVKSFKRKVENIKAVIDCGNGMIGHSFSKVFDESGLKYVPMFFELDGDFPNHEANPIKEENLEKLRKKVIEEKADIGIAFDGDGDRIGFVDEKGNIISSDKITALVGREVLMEYPGAKILYDLRSSKAVKEDIEDHGGIAIMCRVGHSFIKSQMREQNAVFAGELSGHFYFKENSYCENSEIMLYKILDILSREKKPISKIIKPINKYYASGEINFEVDDKELKMKELEEHYKDGTVNHLDGVLVMFDDWWFNVRASNTEPLLRLNMEAVTAELLEEKKKEIFFKLEDEK